MLLDIAGIVVAFSVVMLLLSLLVTSLSQATQHYLRLRGRNLKHGLTMLIETHTDMGRQGSAKWKKMISGHSPRETGVGIGTSYTKTGPVVPCKRHTFPCAAIPYEHASSTC